MEEEYLTRPGVSQSKGIDIPVLFPIGIISGFQYNVVLSGNTPQCRMNDDLHNVKIERRRTAMHQGIS